jgi:hypothetical protein
VTELSDFLVKEATRKKIRKKGVKWDTQEWKTRIEKDDEERV